MKRNGIGEQKLHQVTVECKGRRIPVGPRVLEAIARDWAATIRRNIIDGKERDWSDPQVVPCEPTSATLH